MSAVDELAAMQGNGRAKLRRLDIARMVSEQPPPVPWVIEGLVVRGDLTVLNGREGEGKSLLAMALAAGVALGENQAGMNCRAGRVLIVDTENGAYETHRRVHALGLPATVEMYEPSDGQRFDLRTDLPLLERLLVEHDPDLLILDSFRTMWGGEENDSGDVANVLDPLRNLVRRYQAGTILLHHSGKGNGGSYRGSSAIGASCELGFTLARGEDDDDRDRRSLACWKCRPAPTPPKAWLRLTVERGMVLIDRAEAPSGAEPPPRAPVANALKPLVLAALTTEPQARSDIARAVDRDPKDRSVGRVLHDLAGEGRAVHAGGTETRPLWKVAGGTPLKGLATCHLGDTVTEDDRPTALMERISRALEDQPGLGKRAVRDAVQGKASTVDLALDLLVADGHVAVVDDGPARRHHVQTPYRTDAESDRVPKVAGHRDTVGERDTVGDPVPSVGTRPGNGTVSPENPANIDRFPASSPWPEHGPGTAEPDRVPKVAGGNPLKDRATCHLAADEECLEAKGGAQDTPAPRDEDDVAADIIAMFDATELPPDEPLPADAITWDLRRPVIHPATPAEEEEYQRLVAKWTPGDARPAAVRLAAPPEQTELDPLPAGPEAA